MKKNMPIKYKYGEYFQKWGFKSIRLNAGFAQAEFAPEEDDRTAAWELYVELLTRISTQELLDDSGDEESALNSIYSIFGTTRGILREKGINAKAFTKISIIILNQVIRPFTSKWHKLKIEGAFEKAEMKVKFREELRELQVQLIQYSKMLADMAMVEDLTELVE